MMMIDLPTIATLKLSSLLLLFYPFSLFPSLSSLGTTYPTIERNELKLAK